MRRSPTRRLITCSEINLFLLHFVLVQPCLLHDFNFAFFEPIHVSPFRLIQFTSMAGSRCKKIMRIESIARSTLMVFERRWN